MMLMIFRWCFYSIILDHFFFIFASKNLFVVVFVIIISSVYVSVCVGIYRCMFEPVLQPFTYSHELAIGILLENIE